MGLTTYDNCNVCCSGPGCVNTSCCPADITIPSTLFATVTNVTNCACLAGTVTLTLQGGIPPCTTWIGYSTNCGCNGTPEVGSYCKFILTCQAGLSWALEIDFYNSSGVLCSGISHASSDGESCDPLVITFDNMAFSFPNNPGFACDGCQCNDVGGTVDVVITS